MAHSLLTQTVIPIATIPKQSRDLQSLYFHRFCAFHPSSDQTPDPNPMNRRNLALGLVGAVLGLNLGGKSAKAARRPPPPPPEEKKDPNVSGLMAKVIASKKRKEAMKQTITKLREKGKAILETSE